MPYATGSVRLMQGLLKKILPVFKELNRQAQTIVSITVEIIIRAKSEGGDFFLKQAKRTLAALASARLYLCFMLEFLLLSNESLIGFKI